MRRIIVTAVMAGLVAARLGAGGVSIKGAYVEARTAEVFAGGCVINGEAATTGREALMAWKVDRGSFEGVSLNGLAVVAAVAGCIHSQRITCMACRPCAWRRSGSSVDRYRDTRWCPSRGVAGRFLRPQPDGRSGSGGDVHSRRLPGSPHNRPTARPLARVGTPVYIFKRSPRMPPWAKTLRARKTTTIPTHRRASSFLRKPFETTPTNT